MFKHDCPHTVVPLVPWHNIADILYSIDSKESMLLIGTFKIQYDEFYMHYAEQNETICPLLYLGKMIDAAIMSAFMYVPLASQGTMASPYVERAAAFAINTVGSLVEKILKGTLENSESLYRQLFFFLAYDCNEAGAHLVKQMAILHSDEIAEIIYKASLLAVKHRKKTHVNSVVSEAVEHLRHYLEYRDCDSLPDKN